jgi:hypothetical protein
MLLIGQAHKQQLIERASDATGISDAIGLRDSFGDC